MNYGGNIGDWHHYTPPQVEEGTSTAQNVNSGHLAFIPNLSPPNLNGINYNSETLEKHQNDPNFNPKHFQPLNNISNGSSNSNVAPLASMVQMQNSIGHYGPSNTRNPVLNHMSGAMDARGSSMNTMNEELAYRSNPVPSNGPISHLSGPNCNVNPPPGGMGPRNANVSSMPSGRPGVHSYIPCKGLCCNPDSSINYQQWEKFGAYQNTTPYRDNVRLPGYEMDNRRYPNNLNYRKEGFENKEVLGHVLPSTSNADHRRNFAEYKNHKDHIVPRNYPSSSGMFPNYPVQNYNYPGEYQKYQYNNKEYPKMTNVSAQHVEQNFLPQQRYNNKQMQYQNGSLVPKSAPTTNVNSNIGSTVQNPYFSTQFPRTVPTEMPRSCQDSNMAENTAMFNRVQSTQAHPTHARHQVYQQKIAMQRFSIESHLRELTRIPGYQSHPKYRECLLRYREVLKLQQFAGYQNQVQQYSRIATPTNAATVPPINLQFDQNGVLINSNYTLNNFPKAQPVQGTDLSIENSEKQVKCNNVNQSENKTQEVQHSEQLMTQPCDESIATMSTQNFQKQSQFQAQVELNSNQFKGQKLPCESGNKSNITDTSDAVSQQEGPKMISDKPNLDVRQFLANWDEMDDEDGTNAPDVVLNNSTPVVVVSYEDVTLATKNTVNSEQLKQNNFCTNQTTFESQTKDTLGVLVTPDLSQTITKSDTAQENVVKPGSIIHCISNGADEIPTIHIVNNLEIGNILEVSDEQIVGTFDGQKAISFFEEAETRTDDVNSFTETTTSTSPEQVATTESSDHSPESVKSSTAQSNDRELQTTSPVAAPSSEENGNLKKQNSFTSEESHNPDDISLPDLPTSECTPISTTLNTPIHSDSEESTERTEDLTISANPIEVMQNSPVISFTQSPIKVDPYEHLNSDESSKGSPLDELQLNFHREARCKSSNKIDSEREPTGLCNVKFTQERKEIDGRKIYKHGKNQTDSTASLSDVRDLLTSNKYKENKTAEGCCNLASTSYQKQENVPSSLTDKSASIVESINVENQKEIRKKHSVQNDNSIVNIRSSENTSPINLSGSTSSKNLSTGAAKSSRELSSGSSTNRKVCEKRATILQNTIVSADNSKISIPKFTKNKASTTYSEFPYKETREREISDFVNVEEDVHELTVESRSTKAQRKTSLKESKHDGEDRKKKVVKGNSHSIEREESSMSQARKRNSKLTASKDNLMVSNKDLQSTIEKCLETIVQQNKYTHDFCCEKSHAKSKRDLKPCRSRSSQEVAGIFDSTELRHVCREPKDKADHSQNLIHAKSKFRVDRKIKNDGRIKSTKTLDNTVVDSIRTIVDKNHKDDGQQKHKDDDCKTIEVQCADFNGDLESQTQQNFGIMDNYHGQKMRSYSRNFVSKNANSEFAVQVTNVNLKIQDSDKEDRCVEPTKDTLDGFKIEINVCRTEKNTREMSTDRALTSIQDLSRDHTTISDKVEGKPERDLKEFDTERNIIASSKVPRRRSSFPLEEHSVHSRDRLSKTNETEVGRLACTSLDLEKLCTSACSSDTEKNSRLSVKNPNASLGLVDKQSYHFSPLTSCTTGKNLEEGASRVRNTLDHKLCNSNIRPSNSTSPADWSFDRFSLPGMELREVSWSEKWRKFKTGRRHEDRKQYEDGSGYMNPIFINIEDSQDLCTVPVYTTKDGKISYSPNPNYRALTIESLERSDSSLSPLRKSYCNTKSVTEYCNYLKLRKFLKKRNSVDKDEREEQEIKRSRLLPESLNDLAEKDSTNHRCRVKNGDYLDGSVDLVELESSTDVQQCEQKDLNNDKDKVASETMSCVVETNVDKLHLQGEDKNVRCERDEESSFEDNIKDRNFNDILDTDKKEDSLIVSEKSSLDVSNCASSLISTSYVDESMKVEQSCNKIAVCKEIEIKVIEEEIPSTINKSMESENIPEEIVLDTKNDLEEAKNVSEIQETMENRDEIIVKNLKNEKDLKRVEGECNKVPTINDNNVVSDKIETAKLHSPGINLTISNQHNDEQLERDSNGSTNHEENLSIVFPETNKSETIPFQETQEELPQSNVNETVLLSEDKDKNSVLEIREIELSCQETTLNDNKDTFVPSEEDDISKNTVEISASNEDDIVEKSIESISIMNISARHETEHCSASADNEVVPLASSSHIDTEGLSKSTEKPLNDKETLPNTEVLESITSEKSVEPSIYTNTKLEIIEETSTSPKIQNNKIDVETAPSIVSPTDEEIILKQTKPEYTIEEMPSRHHENLRVNVENPRDISKDVIDSDQSELRANKSSCTSKRKGQYHLSSSDTYKTSHVFDSDTNSKTVPKLIIKKSEKKSSHGQRSECSSTNERVSSSRGYATHPRIPKMIIRNSRSRSLTPSSQEDSRYAEEVGFSRESSPRRTSNLDSVEFDGYSSKVSISLADDDSSARFFVKRKNAKNTIPKMTIKKIKVESTEAYNTSSPTTECKDFDDYFETDGTSDDPYGHNDKPPRLSRIDMEERAEKIPKLTLRRREVEKLGESSIQGADLARTRKRFSSDESTRCEGTSKEPRISKNSLMSISGKIPKVIIKRSSTSAEFKCELSKERKNSIVKKDEWQPKVQLQRSPVLDRMAEELKTSRLTTYIGKTRFQNINKSKKDRRHREISLCRSSSTSDLSATKRKQRRMSDYDYGKATEPELSRNDLRNAHFHHRSLKDVPSFEKRTTLMKKHLERHEEGTNFEDVREKSVFSHNRIDDEDVNPPELQEESKSITANLSDRVPSLYHCTKSLNDTVKSPENVPQNIFDVPDEETFEKTIEYPEDNNKVVDLPEDVVDSSNAMDIPDFLTDEHIDDRTVIKKECMSVSDNELDDLENPRSMPILKVSSRSFDDNDNSVIKVDSSDESQTTIEILPASPDVNPTEIGIPSCIFDGIEGERLYTEDAIPAQLEFELGITDSNIDSSDVFMPGMECSSPSYMFPEKSNEGSNEKILESFTDEFQDFSEFNFRQNSVDDCERELDLSFPSYEAKEQEEMYREVRRNSIESISRGDTLEKEILAAKETLRMCLVKPDREASSRCRPKTAAEKKQGLSFNLNELARSGSADEQQGTSPRSLKNVTSKTEHERSRSRKCSKQVMHIAEGTRQEGGEKEESSVGDSSTTISLKAFKRFDTAMRKNDDVMSRTSTDQANQVEKVVVRTQCKENRKDSWKLSMVDRRPNHEVGEKISKTKEDNMPILVPEVSLNFEQNSDRDSSRSPPVITSLETAEVKDVEDDMISVVPKKLLNSKSETTIADVVTQLAYHEKSTIKHRRYCNLCERWFPTTSRHRRHLAGYQHRHIELTQRRSIHALFILFTGKPCPRLLPATIVRNDCSIGELTPLQLAIQDVAKCWEGTEEKKKEKE
ncbi:hypothetical protein KM043_011799 [Ampulex compressa]|nr:hypothetical protein KM043_011799 [Ampulex compressa]